MPIIVSVSALSEHKFSKSTKSEINLITGLGVEDDCHYGKTVQHLSRIAKNPNQPNLRQVHLIHHELLDELAIQGFNVLPGQLGENILTRNVPLLDLPEKTQFHIGEQVIIELTGLRNPCKQIDDFQKGLMHALLDKDSDGNLIRKSGVMAIIIQGGIVKPNDKITISLPDGKQSPLQPV